MHLETPRLLLRSLRADDISALVSLWTDEDVTRFLNGPRNAERLRETLTGCLHAKTEVQFDLWPLVEKSSHAVIGDCGLLEKEIDGRQEIELIYILAVAVWNRGYATEIARALCDYASRELRIARLVALIEPQHLASARVAENVGMRFERETNRSDGRVMHVFSREWTA
jgi:ribosomal-protein-alanine N-acetyltransferase